MASYKIDASAVRANIKRLATGVQGYMVDALGAELKIEMREVQRRTPVKTGKLRDSIRIEGPTSTGKQVTGSIIAGGPDIPYAMIVHEDLDAYHPVGEAKFIERTLNESAPYMADRIAARMREKMK